MSDSKVVSSDHKKHAPLKRLSSLDLICCTQLSPPLKCMFSIPSESWITGIDVNKNDLILLSDGQNGRVFLYNNDGTMVRKEQFNWPIWDCGLMPNGQIALLTDEDIKIFAEDFFYIRRIKLNKFHPQHMVIDQDNFVIVADILKDTLRIYNGFDGQIITEFSCRAGTPKSNKHHTKNFYQTAVAVNSKDEIVVADPTDPVMRAFGSNGGLIEAMPIINETGFDTDIIHPRAICFDRNNRIWFAEDEGKRIRVVNMYNSTDENFKNQQSGFIILEDYGLGKLQAMVCTHGGDIVVVDEENQAAILDIKK